MSADAYRQVISAAVNDRRDLFLSAAQRLGTPLGNIEKDFWVCWTLDALYHRLPPGGPRLLFRGGTSLSKAFGLIKRFSEDIDITVSRDDLGQEASVEALEVLSGKRRRVKLDAIQEACRAYVTGALQDQLAQLVADVSEGEGRVEVDHADSGGQTLLLEYPSVEATEARDAYIRPVVRVELGARSALDPRRAVTIRPYVSIDVPRLELAITDITTVEPLRTFWDKIVIVHGLRRWYESRGALRHEGQRISRHYYDLHCLMRSDLGPATFANGALGADCVRHARMFFDRPDYDLASARPGSFAIMPGSGMVDGLERDYRAMEAMIFGGAPRFDEVLDSIREIEVAVNGR